MVRSASPASAGAAVGASVTKLGFVAGQVVQELGYDDDVDEELRAAIQAACGTELQDEDAQDVADSVLLWWREDDGDLVDALVDTLTNLADRGFVVLLTPKAGRDGYVDMSEVEEAALAAGLHASGAVNAAKDWSGTRLVAPRSPRR
ncbi:MAG TPA: DUF3052 domain-containing protein [Dermatophilaceae bacterium]|nr:DUF3052 domain-containing protein [Dermatophilaceae bacterium]